MSNRGQPNNKDSMQDDLLKRAKKLQAETEKNAPYDDSKISFWGKLTATFKKKNNSSIKVFNILFITVQKIWKIFQWTAYQHKEGKMELDAKGSPIFSAKRLAIISSVAIAIFFALHATASAVYYYSTKFSETVYITGKQEITTGELYQFGGCTSLPCSTEADNGKFYLIESSFYFPRLYYPEQNVYANIPQQNAACTIKGYGIYFRNLRWLYKSAQLYQHVTNVSCRPYTKDELEKAVLSGTIIKY